MVSKSKLKGSAILQALRKKRSVPKYLHSVIEKTHSPGPGHNVESMASLVNEVLKEMPNSEYKEWAQSIFREDGVVHAHHIEARFKIKHSVE